MNNIIKAAHLKIFNRCIILFLFVSGFIISLSGETWYPLVSGDWDDPAIWTLDPSGALPDNPGNFTPTTSPTSATDNVVILLGRTVTIQPGNDNKSNAILTVSGRLDFTLTTGHSFSEIRGGGKILLSADNFPAGDSTHFVTGGQGEGTVIYYGNSYNLDSVRTFYNLKIDLDDPVNTVTLLADYQVNGSLTVTSGILRINDNSGTTRLNLTVNGDVLVSDDAAISVGTADAYSAAAAAGYGNFHKGYHIFTVNGDFTNYGNVRLTNQAVPDYQNRTTTGAVSLVFTGAQNNTFQCYDTTDLYILVINKGTDQTYELALYAQDISYFGLFCTNDDAMDATVPAHPENRKALWIQAGTLRLTGELLIPSLTEGGNDFAIGENARFILDGENVEVYSTTTTAFDFSGLSYSTPNGIRNSTGDQGTYLFGDFVINDGFYSSSNSSGMCYRDEAAGSLQVNGGEISLTQLRISMYASTGHYSYIQTGGIMRIRGNGEIKHVDPIFGLVDPDMTFTMTGGQLIIDENSNAGAIDIQCSDGNYNVTGGEVILNYGGNSTVHSTANLYDLDILNGTDVTLTNPLVVSNDLTINNNTTLDADGYDLSAGGTFLLEDGGTYTHGDNTTRIIGNTNSSIDINNSTTPKVLAFYNLLIEKDQRVDPTTYWSLDIDECLGRSTDPADAENAIIEIENNLTITRGEFNIARYTVSLLGDVEIVDGHIHDNPSYPGRLLLEGTSQQTIKGSSSKAQDFGHIELDNANGAQLLSNIDVTDFTLTTGILDIEEFNLDVSSNTINGSSFGTAKMIRTSGNASDGGLTLIIDNDGTYTFPVGTDANADNRYTPLVATLSSWSDTGRLQVNVADEDLALLRLDLGLVLSYYWRIRNSDFTTLPYVDSYVFTTSTNDIPGGAFGGNWRAGKVIDTDRIIDGSNLSGTTITFDAGFDVEEGYYTAGEVNTFNGTVKIFYSRRDDSDPGIPHLDWQDRTSWSNDSHTGAQCPGGGEGISWPGPGDYAIIGYGNAGIGSTPHRIRIYNGYTVEVAELTLNQQPGADSESERSRLIIDENSSLTANTVKGGGEIQVRVTSTNTPTLTGDFEEFLENDSASWIYRVQADGTATALSYPSNFPRLSIAGHGGDENARNNAFLVFDQDITAKSMEIRTAVTLLMDDGAYGDITVDGELRIGASGTNSNGRLRYQDSGSPRTVRAGSLLLDTDGSYDNNEIDIENVLSNNIEHQLIIEGDITIEADGTLGGGDIDLFTNNTGGSNVILELSGEQNGQFTDNSSNTPELYRIVMNKYQGYDFTFNDDFTLNGTTNTATKALELTGGDLFLDDPAIDITLTSGGADFEIPSEASLSVSQATVRNTGDNTGIYLDGLMVVGDNSQWLLNGGADNYIRYSASGNAQILINQGTLRVGSQIRRTVDNEMGVLKFNQNSSNSTVIIGENDAPQNNRGVFEILNAGSQFNQVADASITIVRQQTSPSIAAVYIDPASGSLGDGSSITFGNASTPAAQEIGLYSTIDLKNIVVDNSSSNSPTAKMWVVPLTVRENITINAGAQFDANGLNLTIQGDLINSGTFTSNGNTTIFNGTSDQAIVGNTTFYNLTKSSSNTLNLAEGNAEITVQNVFALISGTLRDSSNTIYVRGDCRIDGTHIHSGAGDGIELNGTLEQELTGDGTTGKLTVNNNYGITVSAGNELTITDTLKMDGGLLDIGNNLLKLGVNTAIEEATPFSASNMIQTNISFTDNGVQKTFPAGASTFVYPMGSGGKYTPVTFSITANGNNTGNIIVKPANEMHPSIVEDSESPDPEIVDADNVLQYHWVLKSSGMSGFSATAEMKYDPADVEVTAPYDVYDYITARLLSDASGNWNLFDDVNTFDETNELLIFDFVGVDNGQIGGDYTAGVAGASFNGAFPDNVISYETNSSGNWETGTIWTPNVAGGPRGSIVLINSGHTVTTTTNNKLLYSTEIEGTLQLNTTFGHRLGIVEGAGTIYVEREAIPAGIYDEFFSADGGTLEYGGSTDYDVLGSIYQLNNLSFSGTGERRLSDADILLYGDLTINGGATLEVINDYDREIEIRGDFTKTSGIFEAGTGANASVLMSGVVNQNISGDFTAASALNILEIDNNNGITLGGNVDIEDELILTSGAVTTSGNTLRVELNATISPAAATGTTYVNGALTKELISGNDFNFPVGKNTNPGNIQVSDAGGYASTGDWSAEYFFTNPTLDGYDVTLFAAPVATVSHSEYWSVSAPAGGQGKLVITLDGSSDVANAASDLDSLLIAAWDGAQWVQVGGDPVIAGTATSGTVTAETNIDFDTYSIFTLALEETVSIATASIISGDATICDGELTDILVALTGVAPWSVTYTDGITPQTDNGIMASPHTISVSPSLTTTYTLTAATDNNGPANLVGDIDALITVNPAPTITFTNSSTGDETCAGNTVIFTAGGGSNYNFHVNGSSSQDGGGTIYTTDTLIDNDQVYVVVTSINGCSDTSSTTTITVYQPPVAYAGVDTSICENAAYTVSDASVTNGNGTYNWTHDGNGTLTDGTTLTPTYTADAADAGTIVTLTLTADGNADCIPATDQMQISVEADVIASAGSDTSICENSAYTVSDASVTNGNGTYNWTHDGNGTLTDGNTLTPTYTADAADAGNIVTLTLTADGNADCTPATDQMQISVEAAVIASAGSDTSICENSAYTVSDASVTNGNGTYNWTHDGNGTLTDGATLTPTYTADAADAGTIVTLTLTASSGGQCPPGSDAMELTINPLPSTSNITGNTTPDCFAQGEIYSVMLTPGSKYYWSVPATATIVTDTTGLEQNSVEVDFGSISGNIRVYEINQYGCQGNEISLLIELQGCVLDADFTVNIDNICIEDTITYTNASGGTGESTLYSWDFGDGAVPQTSNTIGPHEVYYSTSGNKTISLTITQGLSDTEIKTDFVTVNATPVADIDPADRCGEGNLTLNAYVTDGDIIDFSLDGGAGIDYTDDTPPYQFTTSIQENSTIEVWVRAGNSITQCNGEWTNSATASSYTVPVTGEIIPDDPSGDENYIDIVCSGDENAGYSITEVPGSIFNWSIPALDFTVSNSSSITVDWNIAGGEYTISVREISDHGCEGTLREETVLVSEPITSLGDDKEICEGESVTVNATEEFSRYLWSNGSTSPEITVSEEGLVGLITWDEFDCISRDSVYVYVYELPVVNLGPDTVICGDNSVLLDAGDYTSYIWSTGQTSNPVTVYAGEKTVSVTVTDENGCSASDEIHINECITEEIFGDITNAFTPNNDGVHDVWIINNISLFPDAKIEVFDRWGRLVFSKDGGYENDWDGTHNGKDLPMDTYYYVIDLKTGAKPLKGTLTIIR